MDAANFLPPLVGSFFGVIAGFSANYWYQSHKNSEDKKRYITMLRSEIEACINTLEEDEVKILPIDLWTSAVNSGALKLFDAGTELEGLSVQYYRIQTYNNRAEPYSVYDWARLEREDGHRLPLMDVKRLRRNRDSLLFELKELKDKLEKR
jgi:hypothetical protein